MLGLTITTGMAFTYGASQSSGSSSYDFSSSYGNLSVSPSTAPINYLMDFSETYTSVQFSNFVMTSPQLTFTRTASFPVGIGQPLASVTTTFSMVVTLSVQAYHPTSTIYPGPGGYRLADASSNLYAATVNYSGSYSVAGPTQNKTGNFNSTFNSSAWSNIVEYDNVGNTTDDPTITFSGASAPYGISINRMDYLFYRGGASFGNLISETVDGVNISVAPTDYWLRGGSSLTPTFIPEPSAAAMLAASVIATFGLRRHRGITDIGLRS